MNARTTNIIGIIITILAGAYFMITLCDACQVDKETAIPSHTEAVSLD